MSAVHAYKLRLQLDELEAGAREEYLDALEVLMAAAQQRIRDKRPS